MLCSVLPSAVSAMFHIRMFYVSMCDTLCLTQLCDILWSPFNYLDPRHGTLYKKIHSSYTRAVHADANDLYQEGAVLRRADDKVASVSTEMQRQFPSAKRRKTVLQNDVSRAESALEGKDLWDCFYRLGTEMIITKTGRRMFPAMRVSFSNLSPEDNYMVLLDVIPLDNKRHRYSYGDSAWFVAGDADPPPPKKLFVHPDSPFTGENLMKQVVSFEKVKLTNNRTDKHSSIILNSMHKYQPRIRLLRNPQSEDLESELGNAETFVFPETAFMAVTSYQNHLITRLKIYSNPFAKGFRDSLRFMGSTERESFIMSEGFDMCEKGDMSYYLANKALEYAQQDTDIVTLQNHGTCWSACNDVYCPSIECSQYRPGGHGYAGFGYSDDMPRGERTWIN